MDERDLLRVKKEIEEAKSKVSELKGKKQGLMESLKKNWGCNTIPQAKKKVQKLEGQLADLGYEMEEGMQELQEKFDL